MERRIDYRHGLRYQLAIAEHEDRRVLADLETTDVSASGLSFRSPEPHGLVVGARFEVRLLAETRKGGNDSSIVMSTDATLIRATKLGGAVQFDAPLKY